jgi:hypothetical protein
MGRIHRLELGRLAAVGAAWALALLPNIASAAGAPDPNASPSVSELVVTASKTIDELVVTPEKKCLKPVSPHDWVHGPKVVSTFPAKDAVVRPGILIVRVTFDQPMACAGMFRQDPPLSDPCPGGSHQLLLSYDRLTVRTACVVQAGRRYGALIGRGESDDDGSPFISLTGAKAHQYEFRFSTSATAPVTTVCEALAEDEQTAREIREHRKLDCSDPAAGAGG